MEREHFSRHYDEELDQIRGKLIEMGGKVEQMIYNAMQSLIERNTELAEQTILFDQEINRLEMEIDRNCLEVLALRQPAARDLRFIALALKVVTDLEAIGDQSASIARKVKELNQEPSLMTFIDLPRLAQAVSSMVQEALDAFVRGDEKLASKVCEDDQAVDELNEQIQQDLLTSMMGGPAIIGRALRIKQVSKCLERIADHATNVAEMVVYMVKGKDIRHALG
jgi:phosphate transport system protein